MHPVIVERYLENGETIAAEQRSRRAAKGVSHTTEERALVEFLDEHFPERRKRRRAEA